VEFASDPGVFQPAASLEKVQNRENAWAAGPREAVLPGWPTGPAPC